MTDVKVVAPMNMGKGLAYNPETKQYDVQIGSGLSFDGNSIVVNNEGIKPVYVDNGTGEVFHKYSLIDFGGFKEISGVVRLPLLHSKFVGLYIGDEAFEAEQARLQALYPNTSVFTVLEADPRALGLSSTNQVKFYYTESYFNLDLKPFGAKEVISANATAGDIDGFRKETAWIINQINTSTTVPIGAHVYYSESNKLFVNVSYTIKFTTE